MLLWCFVQDFVDKWYIRHTLLQNSIPVRQRLLIYPKLTMCLLMNHAITTLCNRCSHGMSRIGSVFNGSFSREFKIKKKKKTDFMISNIL